jgi:hypothetical protein
MNADGDTSTNDDTTPETDQGRTTNAGDDERESREEIKRTGEPQRDALGNADGAS